MPSDPHTTEPRLLHCPFCGPGRSYVELWFDDLSQRYKVSCGACGASSGTSPRDKTPAPAIAAWNRRNGGLANIDLDGMRHAAADCEDQGYHQQADYLRLGAAEIERLRAAAFADDVVRRLGQGPTAASELATEMNRAMQPCPQCHGLRGWPRQTPGPCGGCNGRGYVDV